MCSHEMEDFCVRNGIHRVPTPAYRQAYNGVVEIFFDIVMNMVRCMLLVSKISSSYWNFAVKFATWVRNNTPRGPQQQTPNFLWNGTPTDVNIQYTFGCKAYIKNNQETDPLNPRGQPVRYMGVVDHTNKFHDFLRICDGRIFTTDVFQIVEGNLQETSFTGNMTEEMLDLNPLTTEQQSIVDEHAERDSDKSWEQLRLHDLKEQSDDDLAIDTVPNEDTVDDVDNERCAQCLSNVSINVSSLPDPAPVMSHAFNSKWQTNAEKHGLRANDDEIDVHFLCDYIMSPIYGSSGNSIQSSASTPSSEPNKKGHSNKKCVNFEDNGSSKTGEKFNSERNSIHHALISMLATTSTDDIQDDAAECFYEYAEQANNVQYAPFDEPLSHAAALRSPQSTHWIEAEEEEKSAFFSNKTWEVVDINPQWNLMSCKWVYKIKRDKLGNITRYRARLVIKGFLQREGIDFGDIFSPVVRYSTVRIILAICAHYALFKRHLDCPKAFTQADLDTPCYVKAPPGLNLPKGKCFKLLKSIYGLKQAGRLFHQLLTTFLSTIGFVKCAADTCLWYLIEEEEIALLLIYVDDLLLCTKSQSHSDKVVQILTNKFHVTDMGEISWCLGMRISTSLDRQSISLDLERYILDILTRYDMASLPCLPTPMLHSTKLSAEQSPTTEDEKASMVQYPFRSAISSVMFAMVILRFDISFAVISCARFSANPGKAHWEALVRIFQYLKGTADLKITYRRMNEGPPLLYGMTDSDWATTDVDERRSVIGHCFFISGAIVIWFTQFWKVCLSIFEGEFGSLTEAAKNAISVRHLLESVPFDCAEAIKSAPTTILTDSLASQQVAYNPKFHSRTKHFQIREKWIENMIDIDWIRVQHFLRDNNFSDFFCKAYPKTLFRDTRNKMAGPYQKLDIVLSSGEMLKKRKLRELQQDDNSQDEA